MKQKLPAPPLHGADFIFALKKNNNKNPKIHKTA